MHERLADAPVVLKEAKGEDPQSYSGLAEGVAISLVRRGTVNRMFPLTRGGPNSAVATVPDRSNRTNK